MTFYKIISGAGCLLLLSACAATIQPSTGLVGYTNGIPNYTINGYSANGEMQKSDVERRVKDRIKENCETGPKLIGIQMYDASRMGIRQLGYAATFQCRKLVGAL